MPLHSWWNWWPASQLLILGSCHYLDTIISAFPLSPQCTTLLHNLTVQPYLVDFPAMSSIRMWIRMQQVPEALALPPQWMALCTPGSLPTVDWSNHCLHATYMYTQQLPQLICGAFMWSLKGHVLLCFDNGGLVSVLIPRASKTHLMHLISSKLLTAAHLNITSVDCDAPVQQTPVTDDCRFMW